MTRNEIHREVETKYLTTRAVELTTKIQTGMKVTAFELKELRSIPRKLEKVTIQKVRADMRKMATALDNRITTYRKHATTTKRKRAVVTQ